MHDDQIPYYELLDKLWDLSAQDMDTCLQNWPAENPAERDFSLEIADRSRDQIPTLDDAENWRLYALSRITDWLIAELLEGNVRVQSFTQFCEALGLTHSPTNPYHPFYHEIVSLEPSPDPAAPIVLTETVWPGFQLGSMMFCRSGSRVTAGAHQALKEVAESSTLYWTYRRSNRPTDDQSVGWGHNSQWRTSFRRDFCIQGQVSYNVDAQALPPSMEEELPLEQRIEIVRNRCLVRSTIRHDELYPYPLHHEEPLS